MNLSRNYQLNIIKNYIKRCSKNSIGLRYNSNTASQNTTTSQSSSDGTTHFGFQNVKESEKEQKGK